MFNLLRRSVYLFVFLFSVAFPVFINAEPVKPIKITFVCPCAEGVDQYWERFIRFSQFAALDLGIEFKVIYPGEKRTAHVEALYQAINEKPDYLLAMFVRTQGHKILAAADKAKVPVLLVNVDITAIDKINTGEPREKFPYWLGQIAPDDFQAGYDLAQHLIVGARNKKLFAEDGKIHLLGITGYLDSSFVKYRLEGLKKAIIDNPDVVLKQILPTVWQDSQLTQKTTLLLRRFPETAVIWNVTNEQAQQVISAISSDKVTSTKDIIIGGVDWTKNSLESVANGEQYASLGGHFIEGARALLMLYDYHHGYDFGNKKKIHMKTLKIISSDNIDIYAELLDESNWHKINFKQLSQTHNQSLETGGFDVETLLSQYR